MKRNAGTFAVHGFGILNGARRLAGDLELCVRTVAEGAIAGVFAGTPSDGSSFGDFHFPRCQPRAFMRTVAEGLALRAPAGAPPILSRLGLLDDRRFLTDDGFVHTCNEFLFFQHSTEPVRAIRF